MAVHVHHVFFPIYENSALASRARSVTCSKDLCIVNTLSIYIFVHAGADQLCNDFDCPLMLLTEDIEYVHPTSLVHSISIVHQCSSSCAFKETGCKLKEKLINHIVLFLSITAVMKHHGANPRRAVPLDVSTCYPLERFLNTANFNSV